MSKRSRNAETYKYTSVPLEVKKLVCDELVVNSERITSDKLTLAGLWPDTNIQSFTGGQNATLRLYKSSGTITLSIPVIIFQCGVTPPTSLTFPVVFPTGWQAPRTGVETHSFPAVFYCVTDANTILGSISWNSDNRLIIGAEFLASKSYVFGTSITYRAHNEE